MASRSRTRSSCRAFTIENPAAYANLVLGLLCDDGAVVYLNGQEILRSNMTNTPISHLTPALTAVSGSDEATFHETPLSPALLRAGTNLLAVEVHQVNGQSSDLSFDLFLQGLRDAAPLVLRADRDPGGVKLSWPLSGGEYVLETTPRLPATGWAPITNVPSASQTGITVTLQTGTESSFFRLSKP